MDGNMEKKCKFLLVGLLVSMEFQRAKLYIERLFSSYPNLYEKPDIRPLLNLDWHLYLTKIRRKIGGRVWTLKKDAVVFLNNAYLGDDEDLYRYILQHARMRAYADFHTLGMQQLKSFLNNNIEKGRKYVYLSISIGGLNVGAMLFMLYQELVPKTTEMFLRRCKSIEHGWRNRPIHRIVKECWIQGGGFDLKDRHLPCENYVIPHDRRGVLSMANSSKHKDNTLQFIISLNPTHWMDYKYVAFGQLVQGNETLQKIEEVSTNYESPSKDIIITSCGEYSVEPELDPKSVEQVTKYYNKTNKLTGLPEDIAHSDDVDSNLSESRYKKGQYCLESDLKSNIGVMHLPSYLVELYMEYAGFSTNEEGIDPLTIIRFDQPFPTTQSLRDQPSLKMNQSLLLEGEVEGLSESKEIVQKVIEFDSIPPIGEPPKLSSSENIDREEQKAMFV